MMLLEKKTLRIIYGVILYDKDAGKKGIIIGFGSAKDNLFCRTIEVVWACDEETDSANTKAVIEWRSRGRLKKRWF